MFHHHFIDIQIDLFLSKTTCVFSQIYSKSSYSTFQNAVFAQLNFVEDCSMFVFKMSLWLGIENYLGNFGYLD